MVSFADLTGKLDTTKIRVIEGDVPAGDWIFNGQGMVLPPKKETNGSSCSAAKTCETEEAQEPEKLVIHLEKQFRLVPRKAEEFGVLRQFASDMTPLAGAIAGATLFSGFFGAMAGFAAGSVLGRNVATFSCELDDGRKFNCVADYRIFRRLQSIAHS